MRSPCKTIAHLLQYDGNWWHYYEKYKASIRDVVVNSVVQIMSCGKACRGYARYACSCARCDHQKIVPYTCKNRFCSSCGKKAAAKCLHQQLQVLPQTTWQHITFTMPDTLWRLFEHNRHLLEPLSGLAAKTILDSAKRKGLSPAVFTALHTFGRDLKWNVHIHLSTTLAGLTLDQTKWKTLYFKKRTIMHCWRYEIINLLRQAYADASLTLPPSLAELCPNQKAFNRWLDRRYRKDWIVHFSKPSHSHPHSVSYLARYLKRPPIAQSKLYHYDGSTVIFRYLNHRNKRYHTFECSPQQFIHRLTRHIPDKGFRMIRYYGTLANRVRGKCLPIIYQLINQVVKTTYPLRFAYLALNTLGFDPLACIVCKNKMTLQSRQVGYNAKQLRARHKPLALMRPI